MAGSEPPFRWLGAPYSVPNNPDVYLTLHHHAAHALECIRDPEPENNSMAIIWDKREANKDNVEAHLALLARKRSPLSFNMQAILGEDVLPALLRPAPTISDQTALMPEFEEDPRCIRDHVASLVKAVVSDGYGGWDVSVEHRLSPSVSLGGTFSRWPEDDPSDDKPPQTFNKVEGKLRYYSDRGTMELNGSTDGWVWGLNFTHEFLGVLVGGIESLWKGPNLAKPSVAFGCRLRPFEAYSQGSALMQSLRGAIHGALDSRSLSPLSDLRKTIQPPIDTLEQRKLPEAQVSASCGMFGQCQLAYSIDVHPKATTAAHLRYQLGSQQCDCDLGIVYKHNENIKIQAAMDPFRVMGFKGEVKYKQYRFSGQGTMPLSRLGAATKLSFCVGIDSSSSFKIT